MKLNKKILFLVATIGTLILLLYYFSRLKRKYVFIDGGAHFGESTKAFKSTKLYKKFPWKIYAIEANPNIIDKIPRGPDIIVINKAAWIYDGTIDFWLALPGDTRSSVYKKEQYNKEKITIACFDFGRWLKKNFSKKDYIILSLDMAGSEYEVLEKMILDRSIEYVDRLYVEFSCEMFISKKNLEDEAYERAYSIIQKVRDLNIIFDGDSTEDVIGWRKTWQDDL